MDNYKISSQHCLLNVTPKSTCYEKRPEQAANMIWEVFKVDHSRLQELFPCHFDTESLLKSFKEHIQSSWHSEITGTLCKWSYSVQQGCFNLWALKWLECVADCLFPVIIGGHEIKWTLGDASRICWHPGPSKQTRLKFPLGSRTIPSLQHSLVLPLPPWMRSPDPD